MMRPANIVEAITGRQYFGPAFKSLDSWAVWLTFWKAVYGLPISAEELVTFQECTGRGAPLAEGYREVYLIAGRRSGKSRMMATQAAYSALWGDWADHLSAGERAYLFLFAVDRTQSQVCYNYVKGLLELFPDEIEKVSSDEIQLRNRTTIMIKTSNYATSRGFATAGVYLDELAFYPTDQHASPASELVVSLLPSLLPDGIILGASTPYGRFGYLFDAFKEHWGDDSSDVLIFRGGTRKLNPSFSENVLKRLFKRSSMPMRTEMEAEFREDIETFMPDSLLKSISTLGPAVFKTGGFRYSAFVDPSGLKDDHMTLAISHAEDGMIMLDRLEGYGRGSSPKEVVARFAEIIKSYKITTCQADAYAGEWVAESFREHNIVVDKSPLTASELYEEFRVLAQDGKVRILGDERLFREFRGLEVRTTARNKDSITHFVGGHDDYANSAAGACVAVYRYYQRWSEREIAARLPVVGPHAVQPNSGFAIADARHKAEVNMSNAEIMDEFMGGRHCRINAVKDRLRR